MSRRPAGTPFGGGPCVTVVRPGPRPRTTMGGVRALPFRLFTTIRARIMVTVVLMAGIALAASGAIVAVLQDGYIQAQTTSRLQRIDSELRVLALEGRDPHTGQPFADPSAVLRTHLERSVIAPTDGELGFVGDHLQWLAPETVVLRPENDPELMTAVGPWVLGTDTVIETVRTARTTYRVLVVPIVADVSRGTLVHVVDMDAATVGLRRTTIASIVGGVLSVAFVAAMARIIVGRLLRPIDELRAATDAIDESDLTGRVEVRGSDDLSALALAFNRMLDRVQHAVEGQRRLLDDVGHELRTPVTVLRGHLEVLDPDDPDDVRQTKHLLTDETDRMGVLIDDILLLAKASQSDFVVPVPTQVAPLTDQVFDKARALGDRRWRLGGIADIEVPLDPRRITQAWLQLAANAVKYSDVGSTITLGSRVEDHHLGLWVSDEGIGIAPEDIDKIRSRFARTGEAARRAPGTGLGLSIVESIMEAHSGTLDIASAQGQGSLFTLRIPLAAPPAGTDVERNRS